MLGEHSMNTLETNVFPITNLSQLSAGYRLYRIRGLRAEQSEFFQNQQALVRRLSYRLKSPVTIITRDGEPHLAVRDDAPEPPSPISLVRATAYLDRVPGDFRLDFTARSPETDPICLRFLQFVLQEPLRRDARLWQPSSGRPFFFKEPCHRQNGVCQYRGFAIRVVLTPDGGLGLCVDVKHAFSSQSPLAVHLSRKEFRRWQGQHCIYRMGHQWFDIKLMELSDLTVSEEQVPREGQRLSLLDWVTAESRKPIPADLANLPPDAAVVYYRNNQDNRRAAPAGLCYPVVSTEDSRAKHLQRETILPPHERRRLIHAFVQDQLRDLRFGGVQLRLGSEPVRIRSQMFQVPDLAFGGDRVLSVRGSQGAHHVGLDQLGRARLALLRDKSAGFVMHSPLDRQYLILPQSVADSWGEAFRRGLAQAVDDFYPQEAGYAPMVVTYNDRVPRTVGRQGAEILRAVQEHCTQPGYGVVMIHHTDDRRRRGEDQLAALVLRELRERFDLPSAVIHSATGQDCYQLVNGTNGESVYRVRHDRRARFDGYLRNVALNKVLLTNERWPFVLATPLHADVIIGIDVKHNTAGFTVVGKHGSEVRTLSRKSRQKEMLLAEQVTTYLLELLRAEAQYGDIRHIVLQRDGRVWPSEREGAHRAVDRLKAEGVLPSDATLTILEISKTSPAPLRLFEVTLTDDRSAWIENPEVGTYHLASATDAYLCATGRAFRRPGTVNPLHVRFVEGPMPFLDCLEDLYYLTVLAWTRPEDCTRDPITIKLNDRRLGEDAGEYDADALNFVAGQDEEDVA
jgi:alkylated DNA nucleotide flippase Atl1